jgi:hypothetical protein
MSASPLNPLGRAGDLRQLDLINNLLAKTREGKIPWQKQGMALTMTIPGGLQVNFILSPATLLGAPSWQLLTVRDGQGSELMKVTNHANILTFLQGTTVAGVTADQVSLAADELFKMVYGTVGDELDRAIRTIKKL